MIHNLYLYLLGLLRNSTLFYSLAKPLAAFAVIAAVLFIAWLFFFLSRIFLGKILRKLVLRTRTEWDDILLNKRVFTNLSHLIPAFFIYHSCYFASPSGDPDLTGAAGMAADYYLSLGPFLQALSKLYFVVVFTGIVTSLLNAANEIYQTTPYAPHRSIKGYVQLLKIVAYFFAAIVSISIIIGKNPSVLITGLGVMAGVLMLVFKDTILGFVASIQLSANNMLKVGDWIEMPAHRADGTVTDITLNTVKVQNWDKTITTIPTYAMVSESFTNWKGMEESEGRRIKRSVFFDIHSLKPWTPDLQKEAAKEPLLKAFFESPARVGEEGATGTGSRGFCHSGHTNMSVFRNYLRRYLGDNPDINTDMTLIVRSLQLSDKGLPLEVYVFSRHKSWPEYEDVQCSLLEHILAIAPSFGLRLYQSPSGSDIRSATGKTGMV